MAVGTQAKQHSSAIVKRGSVEAGPFKKGNPYRFKSGDNWDGNASGGKSKLLVAANRKALARPCLPEWFGRFTEFTGEPVDPADPPTMADYIAARGTFLMATADPKVAIHYVKEFREATEGSRKQVTSRRLSLHFTRGMPVTDAGNNGHQNQDHT